MELQVNRSEQAFTEYLFRQRPGIASTEFCAVAGHPWKPVHPQLARAQ